MHSNSLNNWIGNNNLIRFLIFLLLRLIIGIEVQIILIIISNYYS